MQRIAAFEDLHVDQEVPPLTQEVTAAMLVRYAGASEDYAPQHWNHLYMAERGFPGVIIHGWLTFACMTRAVTDWIPREIADVAKFAVRYHRMMSPGQVLCSGKVTAKHDKDGVRQVDLAL